MKKLYFLILVLLVSSCSVKVQEINYGEDLCHFCKMGIVDKAHASQLVTTKGKNFKFDAIECMINFLSESKADQSQYAFILVSNLSEPGKMISAQEATFIISKDIPSPMGAFLSAVQNKEQASVILKESNEAMLYQWDNVQGKIKKH
ncbi:MULTISPECIES: nitrous oxide reductase accessory protein NosL [Myroides]|uniref:nitrous oxide reductase accessory protein NosL n=1 Tax=Myroides TaxID=76831 RepID=UPI00132B2778|nr:MULTISPECIES: nitrous oxide reductase accessory protein NosL [Myroides]MVX34679.1 hypothetical protein [Myroides sp. LoEW2-1]UVD79518.1 nitrous oxide reductase accessory protein NosL [Myroides albus]